MNSLGSVICTATWRSVRLRRTRSGGTGSSDREGGPTLLGPFRGVTRAPRACFTRRAFVLPVSQARRPRPRAPRLLWPCWDWTRPPRRQGVYSSPWARTRPGILFILEKGPWFSPSPGPSPRRFLSRGHFSVTGKGPEESPRKQEGPGDMDKRRRQVMVRSNLWAKEPSLQKLPPGE